MWRVYDHSPGVYIDLFFQFFQIRLESLGIRRDFHKLAVIVTYICTIFQEIRCKNDHFLTRIQDRLEDDIQTAGSSNGHDQIMCRKSGSEAAVQRLRNGLSDILKTSIVHISVKNCRFFVIYKINDRLTYTVRCRNTRISKTEIIYFVCAVFCTETVSFLEHHADR